MATSSLVTFRCYHSDASYTSADTLFQLLLSRLRNRPVKWKGKIIFGYSNASLIDVFTHEIINESKLNSNMLANVIQIKFDEFLIVEMNGALHTYNSTTGTTTQYSKSAQSSRPGLIQYNDLYIVGLPINHKTLVYNSALQVVCTLPHGIEQFLKTRDGNLLTFTASNKVILYNPQLEEIKALDIPQRCERIVQVGRQHFYFAGTNSHYWDSSTNVFTPITWLDRTQTCLVLHDGRLIVDRASTTYVCAKPEDFEKEPRRLVGDADTVGSRWDNALVEVEPGVVAYQNNNHEIVVWNVNVNHVKKYPIPGPKKGFLRCFVFE